MTRQSPRLIARIAGVFYAVTFVAGLASLLVPGRPGVAVMLIASVSYVAVTVLFYPLFKPVNQPLSLLAAIIGLVGITFGALLRINALPSFGIYCLLIGYLVFRSTFAPRFLGLLMAIAGLGWLTFLSPSLARSLSPYNFAPGLIGEGALTLWLLVFGFGAPQWDRPAPSPERA
jgi:hypothetical protein